MLGTVKGGYRSSMTMMAKKYLVNISIHALAKTNQELTVPSFHHHAVAVGDGHTDVR
jgi:hypothetical protein